MQRNRGAGTVPVAPGYSAIGGYPGNCWRVRQNTPVALLVRTVDGQVTVLLAMIALPWDLRRGCGWLLSW